MISTNKAKRIKSIDTMRGLALFMMIYTHYTHRILNSSFLQSQICLYQTARFCSFFSVPLFYYIAGHSLMISTYKKLSAGYSDTILTKYIVARAFIIYILGFILNLRGVVG